MSYFTLGKNGVLDSALNLVGPHDTHFHNNGTIEVGELPKVIVVFNEKRHRALKLLELYGSDDLINAFVRSGVYDGGHRLKKTTRVDNAAERLNSGGL